MSLPTPIPDPPPRVPGRERRWADGEASGWALPIRQLRVLGAAMAGFHALAMIGFFVRPESHVPVWAAWPIVGTGAAAAGVIALFLANAALHARPVARSEVGALRVLMVLPLAVHLALGGVVFVFDPDIMTMVGWLVFGTMLLLIFACLPVYGLRHRFNARLGASDDAWTPHLATKGDRGTALLGLCVLAGGWTAFAGALAGWVVDPWSVMFTARPYHKPGVLDALSYAVLAQPFGMFFGLCAAAIVATLPSNTRMDRSVPLIFLPTFGAGVVGSMIDPILGILGAGAAGVVMAGVAWRTQRVIPPGLCQRCAYDLTDNAAGVCPECGTPVPDPEQPGAGLGATQNVM